MDARDHRAREIQRQISDVLLHHWDPLSMRDEPGHADEYAAYVGAVYRLLASDAPASVIAEHLAGVEAQALGYPDTDWRLLLPVAERLRRLDVQLEGPADAG